MEINYFIIIFMYLPVLTLSLISLFKDKFEPKANPLKNCTWSLLPGAAILFFIASDQIIANLWYYNLLPFLKNYPYTSSKWLFINILFYLFYLTLAYVFLRYFNKVEIKYVFDLKFNQFPFILKVCSVLAVINILSNYLLDFDIFLNSRTSFELTHSMDRTHVTLFFINAIVVGPIVEESVFRGLIYGPLYRKVGRRLAITLASLLWTSVHYDAFLPHVQLYVVGLFIHGFALTWLYDRSGSLIHPIIFHMFINSSIILPYFRLS